MKFEAPGSTISDVEVTNIPRHGFWIFVDAEELFLPFSEFPWFQGAPVSAIINVQRPQPHHLYWPDLDVDLYVDSIKHPEKYPLVAKPDKQAI